MATVAHTPICNLICLLCPPSNITLVYTLHLAFARFSRWTLYAFTPCICILRRRLNSCQKHAFSGESEPYAALLYPLSSGSPVAGELCDGSRNRCIFQKISFAERRYLFTQRCQLYSGDDPTVGRVHAAQLCGVCQTHIGDRHPEDCEFLFLWLIERCGTFRRRLTSPSPDSICEA